MLVSGRSGFGPWVDHADRVRPDDMPSPFLLEVLALFIGGFLLHR